ncbi:hypothetical protein JVU11DRAFT_7313 [Chiua virens]|nr:hypothetical protein JVU11DRAFT_7313 [Chiua virens]
MAPHHPREPEAQGLPAQPSEHRVTWPLNANTQPGLLDKPQPRHTSEQKRIDDEHVRQKKEMLKKAEQDAYQWISTIQAQMVTEQSEAQKDQAAIQPLPKPRVVRKRSENKAMILPPRLSR